MQKQRSECLPRASITAEVSYFYSFGFSVLNYTVLMYPITSSSADCSSQHKERANSCDSPASYSSATETQAEGSHRPMHLDSHHLDLQRKHCHRCEGSLNGSSIFPRSYLQKWNDLMIAINCCGTTRPRRLGTSVLFPASQHFTKESDAYVMNTTSREDIRWLFFWACARRPVVEPWV